MHVFECLNIHDHYHDPSFPTRRALLLPAGEGWPLPPCARWPMRNDADGMEGPRRWALMGITLWLCQQFASENGQEIASFPFRNGDFP